MSSNPPPSSGSADPWAWLGLLKWSLSYSDGTADTSVSPMNDEDKAFLERVMKEGVIDENERMKTILKEVTNEMDQWRQQTERQRRQDEVEELLQELRDIVEQIDYARAFAAMKGTDFLLGCAQERDCMPRSTRMTCLGILATMAQHNPAVQKELLESGAIRILSDLFFVEEQENELRTSDTNGQLRAKIIQAISAMVRSHDIAESVFCQLDQALSLMESGLGATEGATPSPDVLFKRTLFFLRALVTSDSATPERIRRFDSCIGWIVDQYLLRSNYSSLDAVSEIQEISLAMVEQILQQKKSVNGILDRKEALVNVAVQKISALRDVAQSTNEEHDCENAAVQLHHWENILTLLASPDEEEAASPVLLLEGGNQQQTLPQ